MLVSDTIPKESPMGSSFNGRTEALQASNEGSTPSDSTNEPAAVETAVAEATPLQFPEVAILRPCTQITCINGHSWGPKLALAKCGYGMPQGWMGCGEPLLACKMENCPRCNEPIAEIKIRFDITSPVPYPVPLCVPGSKSNAESLQIVLRPQYWRQTQEQEDVKQFNRVSENVASEEPRENQCQHSEMASGKQGTPNNEAQS